MKVSKYILVTLIFMVVFFFFFFLINTDSPQAALHGHYRMLQSALFRQRAAEDF